MNKNEMIMYKTVRKILEAISASGDFKQLGIGQGIVEARGGTQSALCIPVFRFLFTGQHILGKGRRSRVEKQLGPGVL